MSSKRKKTVLPAVPPDIDSLIIEVRGQKVMLDAGLASIYGVPTKALNQAVKRNRERFPDDFVFELTAKEADELNRSQVVTGPQKHRLNIHEAAIVDVLQRIMSILDPPPTPPEPPKPQIGFHIREKVVPYRVKKKPARL